MSMSELFRDLDPKIAGPLERITEALRAEIGTQIDGVRQDVQSLISGEAVEPAPPPPAPPEELDALEELKHAAAGIDRSTKQAAILDALLEGAGRFSSRAAFVLIREDGQRCWGSLGFDDANRQMQGASVEVPNGDSAWARIEDGAGTHGLSADECAVFCSQFEVTVPSVGALLPLSLGDHVAGYLYADRLGDDPLNISALQLLTFVAGQTLETLPVRKRNSTPALTVAAAGAVPAIEAPVAPPIEPPLEPTPEVVEPAEEETIEPAAPEEVSDAGVDAEAVGFQTEVTPAPEVPETIPVEVEPELAEPEPAVEAEPEAAVEFEPEPAVETEPEPAVEAEPEAAVEIEPEPAVEPEAPAELELAEVEEVEVAEAEPIDEAPVEAVEEVAPAEVEHESPGEMPVTMPEEVVEAPIAEEAAPEPAMEMPPVESPPAEPVAPPVSPLATEGTSTQVMPPDDVRGPGWAFTTSEETEETGGEALHEEARRLARLLVTEIKLYNEEQVDQGRRSGDIYRRLQEDIDRSRQIYEDRIDANIRSDNDYFKDALIRILAGGDESLLGV